MVRSWFKETTGGLPRTFWFIWTNTLINRIASFVVILLAIYLTQVRHLSPTYAGFVIGLWGAGGAAGTLLGGVLADRWGRKKTFLTAQYAGAALMLVLGVARGPVAITFAVLALGVASEGARPALSALMIDVVDAKDRLRAFTLNYWVINLGFAFSATVAGLLAGVNYTLVFIIDAGSTVAAATLIAIKVSEPVRPKVVVQPKTVARVAKPSLRAVFADRVFIAFVGVNVLTSLIFMQHISTMPISMANDGLSASTYGAVIALNGVLIVIGQLFMPKLLQGYRRATALAIAAVIIGIGFGLNAFAHTAWLYAIAVGIWTLGEMLNAPSNSATNAELSPADMRGRYQGVFSLSWSAASFLAPILGTAVLQHFGDRALWLGCFGLGLVVAAMNLVAGPARARRAEQLRASGATGQPALNVDSELNTEPELVPAQA